VSRRRVIIARFTVRAVVTRITVRRRPPNPRRRRELITVGRRVYGAIVARRVSCGVTSQRRRGQETAGDYCYRYYCYSLARHCQTARRLLAKLSGVFPPGAAVPDHYRYIRGGADGDVGRGRCFFRNKYAPVLYGLRSRTTRVTSISVDKTKIIRPPFVSYAVYVTVRDARIPYTGYA